MRCHIGTGVSVLGMLANSPGGVRPPNSAHLAPQCFSRLFRPRSSLAVVRTCWLVVTHELRTDPTTSCNERHELDTDAIRRLSINASGDSTLRPHRGGTKLGAKRDGNATGTGPLRPRLAAPGASRAAPRDPSRSAMRRAFHNRAARLDFPNTLSSMFLGVKPNSDATRRNSLLRNATTRRTQPTLRLLSRRFGTYVTSLTNSDALEPFAATIVGPNAFPPITSFGVNLDVGIRTTFCTTRSLTCERLPVSGSSCAQRWGGLNRDTLTTPRRKFVQPWDSV